MSGQVAPVHRGTFPMIANACGFSGISGFALAPVAASIIIRPEGVLPGECRTPSQVGRGTGGNLARPVGTLDRLSAKQMAHSWGRSPPQCACQPRYPFSAAGSEMSVQF